MRCSVGTCSVAIGTCLVFAVCAPLLAQDLNLSTREQEDEQFSFHLGFFRQTDGPGNLGGNPFIDEDETVYEAIIVLDQKMSERDRMNLRFLGDLVSSASITRETNPMFQALQSHPSGNKHAEVGFGWTHDYDDFKLGYNASIGIEASEYVSAGWGLNLAVPLPGGNTQATLKYQGYLDYFEVKLFNGEQPRRDQRLTHTLEGGLIQVLTPKTVASVTLNHTQQSGFLATTWHSVFVNGVEVSEQVPSSRRRDSVTVRVRQSLSKLNAVELGYRFYDDDWGIRSETYEARYFQYVFDKKLLIEPNYRYYDQTGARFFDQVFSVPLDFMTSDPDLGNFHGRSVGLKGTWIRTGWLPGRKADLSLSYDYYRRSDGIDFYWTVFGYTVKF